MSRLVKVFPNGSIVVTAQPYFTDLDSVEAYAKALLQDVEALRPCAHTSRKKVGEQGLCDKWQCLNCPHTWMELKR